MLPTLLSLKLPRFSIFPSLRAARRLASRLLVLLVLPFMLLGALGVTASLLLLEGCQTTAASGSTPATALQTFDALYQSAVSADDLVIRTATTALASGLISPIQAKKILSITDSVKAALDTANAAAQLGNTGTATGSLAAALGPIAILSSCLTVKPLTVATFDTCAAKLVPAVST